MVALCLTFRPLLGTSQLPKQSVLTSEGVNPNLFLICKEPFMKKVTMIDPNGCVVYDTLY